jgi:hypothetical protein
MSSPLAPTYRAAKPFERRCFVTKFNTLAWIATAVAALYAAVGVIEITHDQRRCSLTRSIIGWRRSSRRRWG